MGTFVYSSSCLSWKSNLSRQVNPSHHVVSHGVPEKGCSKMKAAASSKEDTRVNKDCQVSAGSLSRRSAIISGASLISSVLLFPGDGSDVVKQGLLAGRVPGLSEPDEGGWRTYRRPDEKSGEHGVGWNIGEEATIEQIGPPDKVISAMGLKALARMLKIKSLRSEVAEHLGRTSYQFELEPPHVMSIATVTGNRLYNVTGNGLQWKRYYKDLKKIAESFRVV
ncbi:unnamed protein product [Withania somnifera]